ncbi:MAG: putative flavoprotein involved in transport [Frankiales bacterium]|nr:putative flavoprotein involved in transport [Frankiales bacterium]
MTEAHDVVVVGGGQAGLGTARALARRGVRDVVVLEAGEVGHTWTDRWDSLQLFTPRRFSGLPGRRFPRGRTRSPSRTEMAAYLRSYAADLPVREHVRVERLHRDGDGFALQTSRGPVRARCVVLAPGPFSRPSVPAAAADLDVPQLHSSDYHRPSDVPPGDVLVVGGGNSAAQLSLELARDHHVHVVAPRPLWFLPEDVLGFSTYWWTLATGVLNAPADARVSRYVRRRGDAIVGTQLRALVRRGEVAVTTSRVVGASGRTVHLQDGTRLPVSCVLWCTGFRPDTAFVDVPGALDDDGAPLHVQGVSPVAGLWWMGLPWQTRLNSSIVDGVDRDARATADRVAAHLRPGA